MSTTVKNWTPEEERILQREVSHHQKISHAFIAVSQRTGRSVGSVQFHYYAKKKAAEASTEEDSQNNAPRKWTTEEDEVLARYMRTRAGIDSLHVCFLAVAEQIGRTPTAVASHWYSVLSKKKEIFFSTVYQTNITKNRKNGVGVESNPAIWRRVLRIIKSLF